MEKDEKEKRNEEKEKMKKKIRKGKALLLMGVFILTFLLIPQSTVAAEKTGSLTVYYHGVTPQGNQAVLSGTEFSLQKVGEKKQHGWELQGVFKTSNVALTDMSSSGQRRVAEQLYNFAVKEQLKGEVRITEKNGQAVFQGLEEGLYLCAASGDITYEDGTFHSAPFLVFIPEVDEKGDRLYDVTVKPKNEWVEAKPEVQKPAQPEKKPENSKGEGAKTGDNTDIFTPVLFLLLGVSIMVTLCYKKET